MQHLLRSILAFLPLLTLFDEVAAQPRVPESSIYSPKPSQDLSWAYGAWVAKGEHPVHGMIAEWKVTLSPSGAFVAELHESEAVEAILERGQWIAIDREIFSFITLEKNRTRLALPIQDLYNINVISPSTLELRHMETGKVLRLERGST